LPLHFYVASYPATAELHASYADDFTAVASAPDVRNASAAITQHADDVAAWARERGLTISLTKSHSTLFTPDTHQSNLDPDISLDGVPIPLNRRPKILGVTLDTHFTFSPHLKDIADRARARLNILRAVAGSSWGQQKETLVLTYKSLIKSLFLYAAPAWFPNAAPSAVGKLQTIQNAALKIATGAIKMAPADHLHQETGMLPVADSLSLICSQFLVRACQPHHPSHEVSQADPGARPMKNTLRSRFLPAVEHHLQDGLADPGSYRVAIKALHTSAVRRAIIRQSPNRVLRRAPPPVAAAEIDLPRAHRVALSQLRSGYCPTLNQYRHRVGWSPTASCPECGAPVQSTDHLFDCPAHPTDLTTPDLWARPREVASHLLSLPFFGHLSPLPPPPPEPPPRM